MSVTHTKAHDFNENELLTFDLSSPYPLSEDFNMAEVMENQEGLQRKEELTLFSELDLGDLCKDSDSKSTLDAGFRSENFQDDVDMELIGYFSAPKEQLCHEQIVTNDISRDVQSASVDSGQEYTSSHDCEVELHLVEDEPEMPGKQTVIRLVKVEDNEPPRKQAVASKKKAPDVSQSRNAVAARENRLRKKNYVAGLEQSVDSLESENKSLKKQTTQFKKKMKALEREVQYLKNVLANQSTLSALLKNICATPGVKFARSSLLTCQQEEDEDIDVVNEDPVPPRTASAFRKVGVVPPRKRSLESDSDNYHSDTDSGDEWKENTEHRLGVNAGRSSMTTRSCGRKVQKLDHDYASLTKECKVVLSRTDVPCCPGAVVPSAKKRETFSSKDHSMNSGGVCLHVANDVVSLEFCEECSRKSLPANN